MIMLLRRKLTIPGTTYRFLLKAPSRGNECTVQALVSWHLVHADDRGVRVSAHRVGPLICRWWPMRWAPCRARPRESRFQLLLQILRRLSIIAENRLVVGTRAMLEPFSTCRLSEAHGDNRHEIACVTGMRCTRCDRARSRELCECTKCWSILWEHRSSVSRRARFTRSPQILSALRHLTGRFQPHWVCTAIDGQDREDRSRVRPFLQQHDSSISRRPRFSGYSEILPRRKMLARTSWRRAGHQQSPARGEHKVRVGRRRFRQQKI